MDEPHHGALWRLMFPYHHVCAAFYKTVRQGPQVRTAYLFGRLMTRCIASSELSIYELAGYGRGLGRVNYRLPVY